MLPNTIQQKYIIIEPELAYGKPRKDSHVDTESEAVLRKHKSTHLADLSVCGGLNTIIVWVGVNMALKETRRGAGF